MESDNIKFESFDLGKVLFYEVNNPVTPIEIECKGVKTGRIIRMYTKHKDCKFDNFAISESNIGGAKFYYFMLHSGKVCASLPIFIKNNIEVFRTYCYKDPKKIYESFKGAIVGIRGIFNNIDWMLLENQVIDLQPYTFERLSKVDTVNKIYHKNIFYYVADRVNLIEEKNFNI